MHFRITTIPLLEEINNLVFTTKYFFKFANGFINAAVNTAGGRVALVTLHLLISVINSFWEYAMDFSGIVLRIYFTKIKFIHVIITFSIDEGILDTAVNRTNLFYGSVYPEVTRLVSVHGTIDPWMVMGVLSDINEQAPVIIVPGRILLCFIIFYVFF